MTDPRRAGILPKVAEPAWHGPIGDAVRAIAPVTEADPVAVLATVLALFGAIAGDGPHVRVGGVEHPPRVWPLVIGKTGSGRKGTSWAEARSFVRTWSPYADTYLRTHVASGLSSGEGLIAALSPAQESLAPDGRLTVLESEFARVLTAAKREGSTLGQVLRKLWDEDSVSTMTKQPVSVAGAHLTVVAHVTPRELRLRLAESDLAGGTLNRFLPIAAERPRLLAHDMVRPEFGAIPAVLGEALDEARACKRELRRDRAANELWTDAYAALAEDEPDGVLGAVLARGPAYTMRLALTYALVDQADAISSDHLLAALAVWNYAAESARLVFGDISGSSDLDRLASFIASASGGRTRTEVTKFFGNNKSKPVIDALLKELADRGDVAEDVDKNKPGRPVHRLLWTGVPRTTLAELLERTK